MAHRTEKYSAFVIASIESLWPNDEGTEADLDVLDTSYLSGIGSPTESPGELKNIFESGINLYGNDRFLQNVILFFFNDRGTIFISNIPLTGNKERLEQLDYNFIEFLNGLPDVTYDEFPLAVGVGFPSNRYSINNDGVLINGSPIGDDREIALTSLGVINLINPPPELNSEDYEAIKNRITNFYSEGKGDLNYEDSGSGVYSSTSTDSGGNFISLRAILIARADQLILLSKQKEEAEEFTSKTETLNPNSNGLYPISIRRPDFNNLLKTSEDAYKKRRGYFKLIPLNIIEATTRCSESHETTGNLNFSVSFTMDDVIVIGDKYASSQIKNIPTALPISLNIDTLNSLIRGINISEIENSREILSLGFSAYRISGANFPFNIEDLVEANDTVTLWMYHDPSEFDFIVGDSNLSPEAALLNEDFSYILGNATRKSQDQSNLIGREINSTQRVFVASEILNPYIAPEGAEEIESLTISRLDVLEFLKASADFLSLTSFDENSLQSQSTRVNTNNKIEQQAFSFFPNANQKYTRDVFSGLMRDIFVPSLLSGVSDGELGTLETRRYAINLYSAIKTSIVTNGDIIEFWNKNYDGTRIIRSSEYTYENFLGIDYVLERLDNLIRPISDLGKQTIEQIRKNNIVETVEPSQNFSNDKFFNKRKLLISRSHGETPYLAMKGHVSNIKVSYGSYDGNHRVTLSGEGYNKVLKDSTSYYEDLFYPQSGRTFDIIEVNTIYRNMLPPKAITHFVATHAPKFIYFGKPTKITNDMRNAAIRVVSALSLEDQNSTDEALPDGDISEEPLKESETTTPSTGDSGGSVNSFINQVFSEGKILNRGQVAIDANDTNSATVSSKDRSSVSDNFDIVFRFFYPVNYLNTERISEMVNMMQNAYVENPRDAIMQSAISIKSSASISNNIASMAGDPLINQLFVDETGRLRHRITFECWERTPNPLYTPTITDNDIITGASSFDRDSSQVLTMVDIRPYLGGAQIPDVRFAGRSLASGNDYIPVILTADKNDEEDITSLILRKDFYETLSEPFFRYGKKYKLISRDIYSNDTTSAKRKAILLQRFFEKPVKTATISVRNNTSYRYGETVLLSLQNYKHRSPEIIDVTKMLDWLNYLDDNDTLRDLYVGIDERFLNEDSYYLTNGILKNKSEFFWLKEYSRKFILKKFIETFEFLVGNASNKVIGKLTGNLKYITPEFFPTTLWAFRNNNVEIANKFNKNLTNLEVVRFHEIIYDFLIKDKDSKIGEFLNKYPEALNSIRFQNFKNTSYYIEKVEHTMSHGVDASTRLSLTHGQDNLVLLEPYSLRPIGFISAERRMRIGYNDVVVNEEGNNVYKNNPNRQTKDRIMWDEFKNKKSSVQSLYENQFLEDQKFKKLSFLYSSQALRNSSNFMHELAFDLGLS